jgi:hypothetical protein
MDSISKRKEKNYFTYSGAYSAIKKNNNNRGVDNLWEVVSCLGEVRSRVNEEFNMYLLR